MEFPDRFANLLREGTETIQRNESTNRKTPLKKIYEELAKKIDKKGSTIEYYLKGHVPGTVTQLEQLAEEIFKRGRMDKWWLEQFLLAGDHPQASSVCNRLLTPDVGQQINQYEYQYTWLKMHHYVKRASSKSSISFTQAEIQSTSDTGLEFVRHRNIADLPDENESLFLEFTPGERRDRGTIKRQILKQSPELLTWMVLFDPPLPMGQTASYSYRQNNGMLKNWTLEDVEEMFNAGTITKKVAFLRYTLLVPIKDFKVTLEFPPGYPISLPSSGGIGVYHSVVEDLAEKTRLIAENSFAATFDRTTKQWVLQLAVNQARAGLSYELQWIPPRRQKIAS